MMGAFNPQGLMKIPQKTFETAHFDRDKTKGMRLDIAAGTAVRFEPGQTREVNLINIKGDKNIFGFNQKIMGAL